MIALYAGAGCDTRPILRCTNIKTFYYIDSLPKSGHGILHYDTGTFHRPLFISRLCKEMEKVNMKLIKTDGDINTFYDKEKDRTVIYYTNIALPEHIDKIPKINYDTLIVAGFHPHSCVLNLTNKKLRFIGFNDTVYLDVEHENETNIIYELYHKDIEMKFNSFQYYHKMGKGTFTTWENFNHYVNIIEN